MPELSNNMWKFVGRGSRYPSTIYLRDDEIIGAVIEDERLADPQLMLLTVHSGTISISWKDHRNEIINYIEGDGGAGNCEENK